MELVSQERVMWSRVLLEDHASREELRVVSYGTSPPVLEKRHFYRDGQGRWHTGKLRGLSGLDLALILDRLEEFQDVLLRPWRSASGGRAGAVDSQVGADS